MGPWQPALDRDPGQVLDDVLNEKVSVDYARVHHGVVVTPDGRDVDQNATDDLRSTMARPEQC